MTNYNFEEALINRKNYSSQLNCSTDLTPLGIKQAKILNTAQCLPEKPSKIYASPLYRTRQTAMYATGHTDEKFELTFDDRVKERDNGIFTGMKKKVTAKLIKDLKLTHRFNHPSVEPELKYVRRIQQFISEVILKSKDGDKLSGLNFNTLSASG